MIARGSTKSAESRDYLLGATTTALRREHLRRAANITVRLGQLKNKTGGYAADLRDLEAMHRRIVEVVNETAAKKRPTAQP